MVFAELASAEESYREEDEGSAADEVGEVRENDDGDNLGGHKLGLICSIVVVCFLTGVVAMIVGFCCCCRRYVILITSSIFCSHHVNSLKWPCMYYCRYMYM